MTPRVSVVLAVFNGGSYLREAVDSVLAQTYRDFELLLVDDGSNDGAIEALPSDSRIRVLRNERNLGQIPSLNRGLREAHGEYVARLDHDDVCLPRRLQAQVEMLDASPQVALSATWVDIVETNGRLWTSVHTTLDSFADFAAAVVTGRIFLVHPSLMFRRDIVLGLGGYDESLNASEDQDLYRKLVLARQDARVVPETLLRYRRHEQQMTIAKSAAVWESDGRSYDRFLEALDPEAPARTVRLMLRGDPRFWAEHPLHPEQLEQFLASAGRTLGLDAAGRELVAGAIARQAAVTMVSGWVGDSARSRFGPGAAALAAFTRRHGSMRERALANAAPLLTFSSPVGRGLGSGRELLTRTLRSGALNRVRRAARASRFLRRVYARVADTRVQH